MRIGDLAERLGVEYRDVRYVLEQGLVPDGVDEHPGRGEHRDLAPAQAFWLGFVLALKSAGLKAPQAASVADLAAQGVRGIARHLGFDYHFDPFRGAGQTDHEWLVDIGDLKFMRVGTTANPSKRGRLDVTDWVEIGTRAPAKDARPLVTIRVDIGKLAAMLREPLPAGQ